MKTIRPLLVLCLASLIALSARAAFPEHIGIQTWSLKDLTKAKGFLASLDQIKAWGIKEVEGSVVTPGMTPEQVRAACYERGLTLISAHVQYGDIVKDLPAMVHNSEVRGLKFVICPWIPHDDKVGLTQAQLEQAIKDFNQAGAAFRAAGIKFGYHPHGYESLPGTKPGETMLDDMIQRTNPGDVCYEMDVFWTIHGGWDPVTMLNKYAGRWMGLHVKDMRKGAPTGFHTAHAPVTDNVAVGSGSVDWKSVISTGDKVGAVYDIIEDETSDPLTNVPLTLAYLKTLKL